MAHIFCIEAVVAELVHNYLICREIVSSHTFALWTVRQSRKSRHHLLNTQEESRLADLVAVCPVLEMADWADCKDKLFGCESGIFCSAHCTEVYDSLQGGSRLLHRQAFAAELRRRPLEAVGDDEVALQVSEAPACSEGYDDLIAFAEMLCSLF